MHYSSKFGKSHRLQNAAGGGGGGFMANLGIKLPFGMSNVGNNQPQKPENSREQLENIKNPQADPNKQNLQNGQNEPNVDANGNPIQGSQLDAFKDIFKLPVDAKGEPIVNSDPFATPLTNVDPAKLREAAGKMNFAQGLKPEQLQAAMSDQSGQALLQLLQTVAANSFTAAMQGSTGIFESGIQKNNQRFEAALPERIRSTQIAQTAPKHPALSHAAAAPMVAALKSQIANTNPHLTPEKVTEMAEGYVIAMAADINNVNSKQQQEQRPNTDGPDWNALLTPQ